MAELQPNPELEQAVRREFERVQDEARRPHVQQTTMAVLNAEPAKYADGTIVYADGTNWDPGQGEGLYCYYNSKWNPLEPATGWRDILGTPTYRTTGPNQPSFNQMASTVFWAYHFAVNDETFIAYHIPHDYVPSTDIHFHVHWIPSGTDTNDVKWQFEYMYAKSHDQAAYAPTGGLSITATETSIGGTQWQHYTTESAGVNLSITEPDGIIYTNITRITNGATDNTDSIFVLNMDVHYQSNNRATPNKEPSFY